MAKRKRRAGANKPKQQPKPARKAKARPRKGHPAGTVLRAVGGGLGGFLGGDAGRSVGTAIGGVVSKIFGFGDYTVRKNSLVGGAPPVFGVPSIRTRHREFIGNVTGTTEFTVSSYSINPGLATFAPWMSDVAKGFSKWTPKGIVFEYRPTSGFVSGGDTALGTVLMATQYNLNDAPFADKQTMESYMFSTSIPPYQGVLHPVECAPGDQVVRNLFVRDGDVPFGSDPKFYDLGTFSIATQGTPNNVIGEVWVSYDVELTVPRLADLAESNGTQHLEATADPVPNSALANFASVAGPVMSHVVDVPGGRSLMYVEGTGKSEHYIVQYLFRVDTSWTSSGDLGWAPGDGASVGTLLFNNDTTYYQCTSATHYLAIGSFVIAPSGGYLAMDCSFTAAVGYKARDILLTRVPVGFSTPPPTVEEKVEQMMEVMRGTRHVARRGSVRPMPVEPKLRGFKPLLLGSESKDAEQVPEHLPNQPFMSFPEADPSLPRQVPAQTACGTSVWVDEKGNCFTRREIDGKHA